MQRVRRSYYILHTTSYSLKADGFCVWKRVLGMRAVGGDAPRGSGREPRSDRPTPTHATATREGGIGGDPTSTNDQTASHEWTRLVCRTTNLVERRNLAVARIKITICQQKTQDTIVRHHTHAKTKHSASSHPSLRERLNYLCRPRCSVDVVVGGGEHPLFMLLTSLLHRGGRLAQVRAAPRPRRSSSGDDDGELLG